MSDVGRIPAASAASIPTEPVAPPWGDNPPPVVSAEVEAWARALCTADGNRPDKPFGEPKWPQWTAYASYAALAIRARAIVEQEP